MAVVRALAWPEITPDKPPTYLFVPLVNGCVGSGESVSFSASIRHANVSFSFGRIVGVASGVGAAFTMQLLCLATDIVGTIAPIDPPMDRTYIAYPPELVLTNLVVEVPVVSIAEEIFVFSRLAIESTHAAAAYGMSNTYTVRYKCSFGRNQVVAVCRRPISSFPAGDSFSKRSWDLVLRLTGAMTSTLHKGGISQNLSFSTFVTCSESDSPAQVEAHFRGFLYFKTASTASPDVPLLIIS